MEPSKPSGTGLTLVIPLVVGVAALIAGGAAGYMAGKKANAAIPPAPPPKISIADRLITEPQKDWGQLVNKSYAEFTVSGQVTAVEEGLGPKNGESTTEGWFVTLKNGDNQNTFFISRYSDWYEGKFSEFVSWKKLDKPFTIKEGNTLYLQTHAVTRENATTDSFFSWWVFREKD